MNNPYIKCLKSEKTESGVMFGQFLINSLRPGQGITIGNLLRRVLLGDLGGICKNGEYNACTWNPWEYRNELGFPKCNESTMVWCLGIVLCELFNVNVNPFHWSEIAKYDDIDINAYIEKICRYKKFDTIFIDNSKKYNIYKLLKNMLNLDPKKRIKLNSIIKSITIN